MTAYHEMNDEPNSGRPSMHIDETDGIAAHLGGLAEAGSSSDRVADSVGSTLRAIEQALAPIVGQRGVAALYKRSLHLAGNSFPWLPNAPASVLAAMDVGPLTTALAARTAGDAALAGASVIREFRTLLTTLIGHSLAERLLRSVWAAFLSSPPAQDNTP
jgi:hypothetical protein